MKIYNSLSRKKQELALINPSEVKMYVCGPTVYDEPHIGHARSAYIFDVISRYLKYNGYKVVFVRNVTDVDDKIIDKAKKELAGEDIAVAVEKISHKYLNIYHSDMELLGIAGPDKEPKATEYIDKMIKFIEALIENQAAYVSGSDVYFDITKAKNYGKLSNQSLEDMKAGARVPTGEKKKNPMDFALWKTAGEGEPSWDSPWGKGRPGWHIECSVMSSSLLGDEFDIHGGGIDLIFPHHENEMVQSEGAGKKFARYWIHHGLLTINGQKMAKSLGNFITIKDFIEKYKDADILKLFFLSTHYSHPIDYNEEKIAEAKSQKRSFDNFFDKVNNWHPLETPAKYKTNTADKVRIDDICDKFKKAMDDDFNMPHALGSLFELIDLASGFISFDKEEAFNYAKTKLKAFLDIFGLKERPKKELGEELIKKIRDRQEARRNKDFKKADAIRREIDIKFNGVLLDTAGGITFIGNE